MPIINNTVLWTSKLKRLYLVFSVLPTKDKGGGGEHEEILEGIGYVHYLDYGDGNKGVCTDQTSNCIH